MPEQLINNLEEQNAENNQLPNTELPKSNNIEAPELSKNKTGWWDYMKNTSGGKGGAIAKIAAGVVQNLGVGLSRAAAAGSGGKYGNINAQVQGDPFGLQNYGQLKRTDYENDQALKYEAGKANIDNQAKNKQLERDVKLKGIEHGYTLDLTDIQQRFQKGERLGGQEFNALQSELARLHDIAIREGDHSRAKELQDITQRFQNEQRLGNEDFQKVMQLSQFAQQTSERLGSEAFTARESEFARNLQNNLAEGNWRETRQNLQTQLNATRDEGERQRLWQGAQAELGRSFDREMANGNHERAKEILNIQFENQMEMLGVQNEQAQDLLRLSKDMAIEQQKGLYDAMAEMGNSPNAQQGIALINRALKGETDAEFFQRMAQLDANTLLIAARTISTFLPGTPGGGETAMTGNASTPSTRGFAFGGFTGKGNKYEPAGIVHKGEYIIPKEGVEQATGKPKMEYMKYNFGKKKEPKKEQTREEKLAHIKRWSA